MLTAEQLIAREKFIGSSRQRCDQGGELSGAGMGCGACPLAGIRGGVECDKRSPDELDSPYVAFARYHNPLPMIRALELTLERETVQP